MRYIYREIEPQLHKLLSDGKTLLLGPRQVEKITLLQFGDLPRIRSSEHKNETNEAKKIELFTVRERLMSQNSVFPPLHAYNKKYTVSKRGFT